RTRSQLLPHLARHARELPPFPTRRSSGLLPEVGELLLLGEPGIDGEAARREAVLLPGRHRAEVARAQEYGDLVEVVRAVQREHRSEEHTSELQSRENLVCRLLLEKQMKYD